MLLPRQRVQGRAEEETPSQVESKATPSPIQRRIWASGGNYLDDDVLFVAPISSRSSSSTSFTHSASFCRCCLTNSSAFMLGQPRAYRRMDRRTIGTSCDFLPNRASTRSHTS